MTYRRKDRSCWIGKKKIIDPKQSFPMKFAMKKSTIWESASRPLFVKSVWLEAGRRHFLLDYDTKQKFDPNSNWRSKRETTSIYCDFSGLDKGLLLIGSSKVQCKQNCSQPKIAKTTSGHDRRLSSKNLFMDHFKRRYDDAPSKRSSLHDITSVLSNNSHSDEKLAERVLNWLDLAGKTPPISLNYENQTATVRKKVKKEQFIQKLEAESACSQRNDAVKHITIIFNKEGVPVRLNRPARNIDLCAISSSAGAVKRLAGNLASARLYEENINNEAKGRGTSTMIESQRPRPKTTYARRSYTYDDIGKKKGNMDRESLSMRDAKRQLHIFMPSLPKKTIIREETLCNAVN